MRTLRTLLVFAMAAVFIQAIPVTESKSTSEGIQFFDGSWEEALATAEAQNKLIFLDAYASWCGPCKMMDKRVFVQSEVGEYFNDRFINVKMDMEKGIGPELARKYQIKGYPTLLFVDGQGNIQHQAFGYQNTDQLLQLAKVALETGA